jgi:hypothetical protein
VGRPLAKATFTLTLKLNTERYEADILDTRFNIGRQIYNACLNELFKRYNAMKQSKTYQKTLKMSKSKERNKQFREINKAVIFQGISIAIFKLFTPIELM